MKLSKVIKGGFIKLLFRFSFPCFSPLHSTLSIWVSPVWGFLFGLLGFGLRLGLVIELGIMLGLALGVRGKG